MEDAAASSFVDGGLRMRKSRWARRVYPGRMRLTPCSYKRPRWELGEATLRSALKVQTRTRSDEEMVEE